MEILTLLRANIRKKKGAFISIFILTTIIITVVSAIAGVRDNYEKGLEAAFEEADCGDTNIIIRTERLTDEVRRKLEENELTGRVDYYETICANGAHCGEYYDGNSYFLGEIRDGIRLFNDSQDGFESEIPPLDRGEIYLPLGLKAKLSCDVGDKITVDVIFGVTADFTVKGFVQEPVQGSMVIGWKQCFVNADDLESIYAECKPLKTENITLKATVVSVHQAEGSKLSSVKFQRALNLATEIVDISVGALTLEQSERYSTLMPDIIINCVLVFCVFLFVIVLIVMGHSIGTEIEIDYTTLGILKAQGFENRKIRLLFMLQYVFAELAGVVAGSAAAIPLERAVSSACQSVTGVLPAFGFSAVRSVIYVLFIIVCSALIILLKTRRVTKISPVRAISGGRSEIYFDSRLNAPIASKPLSASLAFRQFTSNKKRYAGTVMIAAILTFFMITVNLFGAAMASENALRAMGVPLSDLEIYPREEGVEYMPEIDEAVAAHSEIRESNRRIQMYVSVNGENLLCQMFEKTEYISGLLKGRVPEYENEIVITKMVGEALELGMGDKVTVSHGGNETECVITGIIQSTLDSGMCFLTNFLVAEKIGIDTSLACKYFVLEDKSKLNGIADDIEEKYGEALRIYVYDSEENLVEAEYGEIIDMLKLIIYVFSVVFAFVVIRMACSKAFAQERADIGIYKAIGFTSRGLRFGFAVRYLIVSFIGALIGMALSFMLSARVLSALLRVMGISRVVLEYTAMSVIIPVLAIGLCYFVFAYLSSKKVRRVEVRELVSE